MKHINELLESILDTEERVKNFDRNLVLDQAENALYKRSRHHTKKPLDMFGREISVGDICFAFISAEFHMIQVEEIVNDGGWAELKPTVDYKYIDGVGLVHPSCCILIPKNQYSNFLKLIK
jgi:hypothetical protein